MKMSNMIKSIVTIALSMIITAGFAVNVNAVSISLHSASSSWVTLDNIIEDPNAKTIEIYETWYGTGYGFLMFEDLENITNYTVTKYITNASNTDWTSFSLELLDRYIAGVGLEDDSIDPRLYPGWVPDNPDFVDCSTTPLCFSTSNDADGLSFAQESLIPRSYTEFSNMHEDESTHQRDFLDFYNGTVAANGGVVSLSFGLRVHSDEGEQQPFLLAQRPNELAAAVPEPSTIVLLVAGILILGGVGVRIRTTSRKIH